MINSSNLPHMKTVYIDALAVHDYIQVKSKIKILDTHHSLPWVVFSDLENNILVFDALEKKPIRAFHLGEGVKSLKFFNTKDKHYINNYDLNEIKKIKGIPFSQRASLLIIVMEKVILFYSIVSQNVIKTISSVEIEGKTAVKCEVLNFMYAVIQTSDGSLVIWNLLDWTLVRTINKSILGKPVGNFTVITNLEEESFVVLANTSGNIVLVDIMKKDIAYVKMDEKSEHDSNVLAFDFNPYSNMLCSMSKNAVYIVDVKDIKNNKKFPNFTYHKSEKPYGIVTNFNHNFTKHSYFIYGKTSVISSLELRLKTLKSRKIDSKEMKTFLSFNFDLESQNLPKVSEKAFKIYTAKFLNHTNDFLILGTNKGVVITKFNAFCKADITALSDLIEIQSKFIFFSLKSSLKEKVITSDFKITKREVTREVFDNKSLATSFSQRFAIKFSFDKSYLALIDIVNNIYSIHSVSITEDSTYKLKAIKFGKCTGELEWCPFDSVFAVTTASINQVSTKSNVSADKNRLSNSFKVSFSLNVYTIRNEVTTALYVIDELPCHRIFGGIFLGVVNTLVPTTSSQEDITFPGLNSSFTYATPPATVVTFYQWTEKSKLDLYISEEPKVILHSADLNFMCVVYNEKYTLYTLDKIEMTLFPTNTFPYKICDAMIHENFCLVFLTDKGVYYHLLNEEGSYPMKLLRISDQMNNLHLKYSKRIREKSALFTRKLYPQKILGVFGTTIIFAGSFNEVMIMNVENVLFSLIEVVSQKRIDEMKLLMSNLEKKYIKSVIAIVKHYYQDDPEGMRRIFMEMDSCAIEQFELFKYNDLFINDYLTSDSVEDKTMRTILVRHLIANNQEGIANLYKVANRNEIPFEILCSKYTDQSSFLKSMLVHNRNFESYVFNENYKINREYI